MATDGEPRLLPLSFYDGKCEINIGQVKIDTSVDYKAFQSILSQKIGISPNQMSIYFVDRSNNPNLMHQRRILITGKASFNLILQGKDCTVLVVLKRSRKVRRQNSKLSNFANPSYDFNVNNLAQQHDNLLLLSRNMPAYFASPVLPYYNQIAMQEILGQNLYNYPLIQEPKIVPGRCNYISYCNECMSARNQGKAVQFHLCENDAVIVSFRSAAGPVARPGGRWFV
ncbi:hypothetical protein POM88_010593 [Heracleum sosnowskyi]|uniref:DUF7138 domain-containing protein n=1 Tax=Heracleum sosnowskyi TaxID=360622 RepID=A0AAD8ISX9_9APIA|nr:hypothetical protein POM88_010593 [Heracleum sosnowskyi]